MLLFISAFGLGLALFATPGAITAQLLRGLGQGGFRWALFLQLGALIGMSLWAIIAFVGAAFLIQNTLVRTLLGATGVLLLLLLMWQALRDAYRGKGGEAKAKNVRGDFFLGATLTLANPFPIVFWLSVLPTLMVEGQISLDFKAVIIFFTGFLLSAFLWSILMSSLIAWGRRFVTPSFFRFVNLVCGLFLGFFALKLLWSTITLLQS